MRVHVCGNFGPTGLLKKPGGRKKRGTGTRETAAFPVPVFC